MESNRNDAIELTKQKQTQGFQNRKCLPRGKHDGGGINYGMGLMYTHCYA